MVSTKSALVRLIFSVALCMTFVLGQNASCAKKSSKEPKASNINAESPSSQVVVGFTSQEGNIPMEPVINAGKESSDEKALETKENKEHANYAAMISAKIAQRYITNKAVRSIKSAIPESEGALSAVAESTSEQQNKITWTQRGNKFIGEICQKVSEGRLNCSDSKNCATNMLNEVTEKIQKNKSNTVSEEEKKKLAETIVSVFSTMSNPMFGIDLKPESSTPSKVNVEGTEMEFSDYVKNKLFELRVKSDFHNNPDEYVDYLVQKFDRKKVPMDEMCLKMSDNESISQCTEMWLKSSIKAACSEQLPLLTYTPHSTASNSMAQRNFAAVIINREYVTPGPSPSAVLVVPPRHHHNNCDEFDEFMFESGYKMSQYVNAAFS